MFRVSKLKKMRNSHWMEKASALGCDKVLQPASDESKEWGIQPIQLGVRIRLDQVGKLLTDVYRGFRKAGTEVSVSDGVLAAHLHKLLTGLTRREASDAGFWAYLSAFGCPEYVCWRWPSQRPTRLAGSIRRNALARLWWWAEVTHDPDRDPDDSRRYDHTRVTEGRQDLVLWCGDCAFSGNPQIVRKLCDLQLDKKLKSAQQQAVCRTINRMLKTVCMDGLPDESAIRAACDRAYSLSKKH